MPELADVEGFRRVASRRAGRRIGSVSVPEPVVLRNTSPQGLGRALKGRVLGKPRRHGKWLLLPVEGRLLAMHFGMTGELLWIARPERHPRESTDAVVLGLDGGELRYRTRRKLGGVWLARDEDELRSITGRLGPDAAALDRRRFVELLASRTGQLKPALMDQHLLAGLGNELSDEILWRARLHPRTPLPRLSRRQLDRLHEALQQVLAVAVRAGRLPDEHGWLAAERGVPEPLCPRCGHALARGPVGGRTSYWCPRCQRE